MSNKLFAVSALVLALSACDDGYSGGEGNHLGEVSVSGSAVKGQTLTASVTDGNEVDAAAISYQWMSDGEAIVGANSATYMLTDAEILSNVTVRASYTDNAGYDGMFISEETATVLNDIDTLGVITLAGDAVENGTLKAFLLDDDGNLTSTPVYTWTGAGTSTGNAYEVVAADVGNTVSVSIDYTDDRGFVATVVAESEIITSAGGPIDPNAKSDDFEGYVAGVQIDAANTAYATSNVDGTTTIAQVSDVQAKDSLSLYIEDNSDSTKPVVSREFLDGAAASGSVSFSAFIPSDGYVKSSYFYLGTSASGSSSSRYTEIVFGGSTIKFRNESGSQKDLVSYDQDTWVDVTVAWTDAHAITVTIDGTDYMSYDDGGPVALVAENDTGAPTLFAIYAGDNGSQGTYSFFDDIDSDLLNVPYVEPLSDDFEAYVADVQIDDANSVYTATNVDGTTTIAKISDAQAKDSLSLYIEDNSDSTKPVVSREFTDGAAASGSVSFSAYIPSDGYVKSSYFYLGTSEGGSSSSRYTEIVFGGSTIKFRNESGSQKDLVSYDQDTWVDVTVAWTDAHAVTVTIDGTEYTSYDDGGAVPLVAENDTGAPTLVAIYAGDNGSQGTYSYFDNLDSSLFDAAAEPTITDDFEGYVAGIQIDAANSLYTASNVDGVATFAEVSTGQAKDSLSLYIEDNSDATKPVVSREFSAGAAASGSVSFSAYIPDDGYVKSSYFYLGTSEGGSSSSRYTEIVFGGSTIKFRNESGSQKDLVSYDQDTWVDVTVAWTDAHAVTVTIDGTVYTSYDDGGAVPLVAENDTGAPTLIAIYAGDNGSQGTYSYFDNLNSDLFD